MDITQHELRQALTRAHRAAKLGLVLTFYVGAGGHEGFYSVHLKGSSVCNSVKLEDVDIFLNGFEFGTQHS